MKKRIKIWSLAALIVVSLAGSGWGASDETGSTASNFLKIGVGARSAAMGEAYGAIADDVFALYWNPAGLVNLKARELSFMHTEWLLDTRYEYLGFGQQLRPIGSIGAGLAIFDAGEIPNEKEGDQGEPLGRSGTHNGRLMAFSVGWGFQTRYNLSAGAAVKIIHQKIAEESDEGVAIDLGLLYVLPLGPKSNKISFVLQNIGPDINDDPLPFAVKIGTSHQLRDDFILGLEVDIPRDNILSLAAGGEKQVNEFAVIRAGYKFLADRNKQDALSGFSAGVGISHGGYKLDYAVVTYGKELEELAHRLALLFRW
ncbi:MAG: PorV/PorQ family protein [bacterium]